MPESPTLGDSDQAASVVVRRRNKSAKFTPEKFLIGSDTAGTKVEGSRS